MERISFSVVQFLFPSLLLLRASSALSLFLCSPPLVSWDPSSIRLNTFSKPSTPPHPLVLRPSLITILVLWVGRPLSLLSTHFRSKVKSTQTPAPPPASPSRPRWVEQKVVVISSPLGYNGRSCAAPAECNALFLRQLGGGAQRGADWPDTPSRQTILLFPLMVCSLTLWLPCPLPVEGLCLVLLGLHFRFNLFFYVCK